MKIDEVCSCGASLVIDTQAGLAETMRHLRQWRRAHTHSTPTSTDAIGYPLPEANKGYDETGDPHSRRPLGYQGTTEGRAR